MLAGGSCWRYLPLWASQQCPSDCLSPKPQGKKRIQEARKKELRSIANRISQYAKSIRQRFPDGAVVVSEDDLAAQLRKRPDYIVSALNALLNEQKVERMPLTGYWRLNA